MPRMDKVGEGCWFTISFDARTRVIKSNKQVPSSKQTKAGTSSHRV